MSWIKKVMRKLYQRDDLFELLRFGVSIGLVLMVWGCVFVMRQKQGADYFFVASLFFLVTAICAPVVLNPIESFLKNILHVLRWGMTSGILVIVFYLVITPIGFFARMFRHRFLDLRFKTEEESYWIGRFSEEREKKDYENQF